eukprot:TRINITY_DN16279_c0_g1_i1.p1 TRINITY_DN16279_c0_g1~~TRINITY_DN16279_c0_g1_i1.p1  ORF type:complete len:717 (+),score=110.30 TRINITY_DN16279_c0_g1_i1:193-2343(+)
MNEGRRVSCDFLKGTEGLGREVTSRAGVKTLKGLCVLRATKLLSERRLDIARKVRDLPVDLGELILQCALAQDVLDDFVFESIVGSSFSNLQIPNYQATHYPSARAISNALKRCCNVSHLNLHDGPMDSSLLKIIAGGLCSSLRYLDLSQCEVTPDLSEVIRACRKLSSLDLSGCLLPSNLFNISQYQEGAASAPKKRVPLPREDTAFKKRKQSQRQNVSDRFHFQTDYIIKRNTFTQENLKDLKLSGCSNLSTESILHISTIFPCLTSLDFSHISVDLDLCPIFENCEKLLVLNINGCVVKQNNISMHKFPPLEALYFSGTGILEANFLGLLSKIGPTLLHLKIRNKFLSPPPSKSTTFWLCSCTNLKSLDLYGVSPLGRDFLPDFTAGPFARLESLDITHCDIPHNDMDKIFSKTTTPPHNTAPRTCANFPILGNEKEEAGRYHSANFPLSWVSLTLNQPLLVDKLEWIGKSCSGLEKLCINLHLQGLLEEDRILNILKDFKNLNDLEIWCCKSMSLCSVYKIMELCPKLKRLLLSTADPNYSKPPLSEREFRQFTSAYPHLIFKIWHHSIYGNRHFRFHQGYEKEAVMVPRRISKLSVKPATVAVDGKRHLVPQLYIDNIPIWSNESPLSLNHLRTTTKGGEYSGALPLINEWCCECNVHNFNGVLFYHNRDYVIWETHEPGTKKEFCFKKQQYLTTINHAQFNHMLLEETQN